MKGKRGKEDKESTPPKQESKGDGQAKAKNEVTEQQIAFAKVLAFYYWGNFWGK